MGFALKNLRKNIVPFLENKLELKKSNLPKIYARY